MKVSSAYIGTDAAGKPSHRVLRGKLSRFFEVRTLTTIDNDGFDRKIQIRRKIAIGLLEYFLATPDFRGVVLAENEQHAVNFYNRKCRPSTNI